MLQKCTRPRTLILGPDADRNEVCKLPTWHLSQALRPNPQGDLLVDLGCIAALGVRVFQGGQLQQAHPVRVHIHPVVVLLVIQFGRHELRGPQDRLRRGSCAQQSSKAQIANLHHTLAAVDEYVVALQVAVNDGRAVAVQIHQPTQDLPCPAFQHIIINEFVPFAVLAQGARSEQLSDEVDAVVLGVQPGVVETHDIFVLQLLEHPDLREQAISLLLAVHQLHNSDLVPSDFCALLLIEPLVNCFERSTAQNLCKATISAGGVFLHYLHIQALGRFATVLPAELPVGAGRLRAVTHSD
mmetsp:Transcript_17782/g.53545  ORF Transcript_17782/g.53545 Transcript_17782/m.53545 type:complete len:298 (+) Transcript_17782:4301-5194(+)